MALGNKRTKGQATAAVEELYIYKHATDNEPANILNTLIEGCDKWYAALTLRGTVNVGQEASSLEKIQVDQFDAPIGVTAEPGDFTFECFLPSFEKADLQAWLGDDVKEVKFGENEEVEALGLNLSGQIYTMSVLLKSKIGPYPYMLFSRAQVSIAFSTEDKVFGLRVSGQILAPSDDTNMPLYFIPKLAAAPENPTVALNKETVNMSVGATEKLVANITPTGSHVTWRSDNTDAATVDQNGNVKAIKDGHANIFCVSEFKSKDGSPVQAICEVDVA